MDSCFQSEDWKLTGEITRTWVVFIHLKKMYTCSVKVYGQHWAKTTNKNKNVLTATSLHIIIHKLTTVEVRRQLNN